MSLAAHCQQSSTGHQGLRRFRCIVPLKYIEYAVYRDLMYYDIPKAILYVLKGDY